MACMPMAMSAEVVDGINYSFNKENKTAEVAKSYYVDNVMIPEKVFFEGTEYTVNSIGEEAFANNYALTSVSMGNSVKSIGTEAFAGCPKLTTLSLSKNLETIGDRAFWLCGSLHHIAIPNSVKTIGAEAFANCSRLSHAFIGNGVTSIGKKAFAVCPKLTFVSIGNHVTSIADEAFSVCPNLTSVVMNVQTPVAVDGNPFPKRTNMKLFIPQGNDVEAYRTAAYWKDFASVEGREEQTCGKDAYWLYDKTKRTLIIYGNGDMADYDTDFSPWYTKDLDYRKLVVADGITHIGENAFMWGNMTTIQLPNSVRTIGMNAFEGCSALSFVNIPEGVESIGESCFSDCGSLLSVKLPNSLKEMGEETFRGCSSLDTIYLGNGLDTISSKAFDGCTSLTSVTLPK